MKSRSLRIDSQTEKDNIDLPDIDSLTDEDLVAHIVKTKDSMYYGALYDRYADKVYSRCLSFIAQKEIAQDLTHDLFIKLFFKLKTFNHRSSFSTWLYAFTYNFCINYLNRQHKVKQEREQEMDTHVEYEAAEIHDVEIFALKSEKLGKALNMIDTADKLTLLMKYQDDFTIKDLSETLKLGESAVKMRLNRAKKKVLEAYEKLD